MKHFLNISVLFILLLAGIDIKASHISGGDITYTCLGNNQFEVTLNLFQDCSGFDPGATQTITATSPCGGTQTITVNRTPNTPLEVSQLCPADIPNSTCNGGSLTGMYQHTYTGIITLTPACNAWTLSWTVCCRNTTSNVPTSSSDDIYFESTLNTLDAPCNNGAQLTAQPIPYVCANQQVNYSYGVVETDGDSLVYSLVPGLSGAGNPLTYSGSTGTAPIAGITINPNTGQLTFTPTTLGNFIVVILVQEYRNGVLIGSVMRDIQFVVQNCSNNVPDPTAGAIDSFAGNAIQTGNFSIEMCEGNNFTFSASYTDPDPADTLTIIHNITAALPGSTVNITGYNPITLTVSWTAPIGSASTSTTLTVQVQDDACPVPGLQTFVYDIDVSTRTSAGADTILCFGQSANLLARGGNSFTWSVLSGDPITPATFSCDTCAAVVATPTNTTTYVVVSDLSTTCINTDTVTVYVVPDFTYTLSQTSTTSCMMQPVGLNVTVSPAIQTYYYEWSPAGYLDNNTISNPTATINAPGNYNFTVEIRSIDGCMKIDSIPITVAAAMAPDITALSDTLICAGGQANLDVQFNNGIPSLCGPSLTNCTNTTSIQVGSGTINTALPSPYYGWYEASRMQILYTATELNALGFVGGKISGMAFNVATKQSTAPYNGYTIKMACVADQSVSSFIAASFTTVFSSNVTTTLGWNIHNFTTAYEWDGVSNLLVEICWENSSFTDDDPVFAHTTAVNTFYMRYNDNVTGACTYTGWTSTGTPGTQRPNTRFLTCSAEADPNNYSYTWTPSNTLNDATIKNPVASPSTSTTYQVVVTDINGGCTDTGYVEVTVGASIDPAGPYCMVEPNDTLSTALQGGVWTGNGIVDGTLGIFSPATAGIGQHEIVYTLSGICNGSDTIYIEVFDKMDITFRDTTVCYAEPAWLLDALPLGGTFTGPGVNGSLFDPAIAGPGVHTIYYDLGGQCPNRDSAVFTINLNADASFNTSSIVMCNTNDTVQISQFVISQIGTYYGAGIVDGNLGYFVPSNAGPGYHYIKHSITGSCADLDSMLIIVNAFPPMQFDELNTRGCSPLTTEFSTPLASFQGTCHWDFGDGTTSNDCNPTHEYTVAGFYDVSFSYTTINGCSDTLTKSQLISVWQNPVAAFGATPQPANILEPTVTFHDSSTYATSWEWTFTEFDTSMMQNPVFTFADTGHYPVTLLVYSDSGCSSTITKIIFVEDEYMLYVPNAFTPNGDGLNDVFEIHGRGFDPSSFQIQIYNRWGEEVFSTKVMEDSWNGRMKGSSVRVPQGVYVYKIRLKDHLDRIIPLTGTVTVIE